MKRTLLILCLFLVGTAYSARKKFPVILVAGQSNADGRVPLACLPEGFKDYKYCLWSYGSGDFETATGRFQLFSPRVAKPKIEASWGFDAIVYYLLEQYWQQPFYVIKQTMGGTAIDTTCTKSTHGWFWSVDARQKSLLRAFCQQIDECLSQLPKDYDIKCLLWHQGESDMTAADRYHDNLKAVVAYIRQHLVEKTGRKEYDSLPVVCGTFAKGSRQGSPMVAAALYQLEREDKDFYVVDATDLTLLSDQLHFDARGAEELGRRVFAKMRETGIITNGKGVVWFDGQHPITYQMPRKVEPVVKIALEMWKGDMLQVTGMEPVASSKAVVKVVQASSLPTDGFCISIKGGQIVIEGSNGRGMAYGLLELSRIAGVSPWVWWGDVVPEKKARLTIAEDFVTEQSPSVEYRGIFLNDEDWSLRPWSSKTFEPAPNGQIGPKTYRKIFELLLRLRANTIWPAMHEGTVAFFQTSGAKAIADSCGIVIGTSHCEPLLRNNVGEWDVKQRGRFNYKTNREQVQQYWIERLQEVKHSKDNMFTIGMRGIHDGSMEGYKTTQEKLEGLQQIIDDQQELLRRYIGAPEKQMQVFVPYKEVLELYEKGLKVPDYVTLMWCDDNYGYMTRLSNAEEQQRTGGGGIYYHLSYWGRPHDYLWLTTTQPGLIYNELREAYDHNCRRLWIANVHDPKVAGYDLEIFLDMAWNIECVSGEILNDHYRNWLCRQFGQEAGLRLFPAMHEFYRLCGERRPEFMGWTQVELDKKKYNRGLSPVTQVPLTANEAAARLEAFERVKAVVKESRAYVRPALSDAFFAAIEYPVFAAAAMSRKIFCDSADSHQAYEEIVALTRQYNEIDGGKWRNLMDSAPRKLPVFDDVRAELTGENTDVVITCNACDYVEASEGVKKIQMLGHSMNVVALPKDGWLVYRFEVEKAGDYTLQTALIPTQPNDADDLRYSISIDGQDPVNFSLKEPFRSERWKENVLCGQAHRTLCLHLVAGSHTLTIRALDNHIIVDMWNLNLTK